MPSSYAASIADAFYITRLDDYQNNTAKLGIGRNSNFRKSRAIMGQKKFTAVCTMATGLLEKKNEKVDWDKLSD